MIYTFYIYLLASTILFLLSQQKRSYFILRFILVTALGLACSVWFSSVFSGTLRNFLVFTSALVFMTFLGRFCYNINWHEALFCSVGGYSVQFIQSMLSEMVERSTPGAYPHLELIRLLSALIVLPACYFLFCRKLKKGQNVNLKNGATLFLLIGAVMIEIIICYNLRLEWQITANPVFLVSDCLLLIICSFCLLTIQFSLLVQKDLESELAVQQQLMRKEQNQYQMSKDIVDTINRKCHDMRHQIHTIGSSAQLDPDALKEMEDVISIYDAMYQTGSKALDIILAEKALMAQNNGIIINCMADGEKLNFMSDTDIYSLFGNLLENAIHAVQPLDPEKRIIGLVIRSKGALMSVNAYNCYSGEILMEDGMPVTASTDTLNRGFGVKSIVAIVKKYGGTVTFQAKEGIFDLNILFSLDM